MLDFPLPFLMTPEGNQENPASIYPDIDTTRYYQI
jgi:hypothetical protein